MKIVYKKPIKARIRDAIFEAQKLNMIIDRIILTDAECDELWAYLSSINYTLDAGGPLEKFPTKLAFMKRGSVIIFLDTILEREVSP